MLRALLDVGGFAKFPSDKLATREPLEEAYF